VCQYIYVYIRAYIYILCIYQYIYTYIHVCMYTYMCKYIQIKILRGLMLELDVLVALSHPHICAYLGAVARFPPGHDMQVCMHVCVCDHIYMFARACLRARVRVRVTCTHTHVHTHTYRLEWCSKCNAAICTMHSTTVTAAH